MLIEWNGNGPLTVHDPRKSSNYKLASVIVCVPGLNKLEDEVWHGANGHPGLKDNPELKRLIEEGQVVVQREKGADKAKAEAKGEAVELHGLTTPEAVKLVKKTLNVELLTEWVQSETRPKVKYAIDKKLDEITKVETPKEKEE